MITQNAPLCSTINFDVKYQRRRSIINNMITTKHDIYIDSLLISIIYNLPVIICWLGFFMRGELFLLTCPILYIFLIQIYFFETTLKIVDPLTWAKALGISFLSLSILYLQFLLIQLFLSHQKYSMWINS